MGVNSLCESIAKYVFFNSSCSGKLMMVQHEFHFCYNAFYLENSLVFSISQGINYSYSKRQAKNSLILAEQV